VDKTIESSRRRFIVDPAKKRLRVIESAQHDAEIDANLASFRCAGPRERVLIAGDQIRRTQLTSTAFDGSGRVSRMDRGSTTMMTLLAPADAWADSNGM